MDDFKRERSFIQGSLFGMAVCNALVPRDATGSRLAKFVTGMSMTICVARAAVEDGGYRQDKFTYLERLLEWFKDTDPCERGSYLGRSVVLALNAWDRQLAIASATRKGDKKKED